MLTLSASYPMVSASASGHRVLSTAAPNFGVNQSQGLGILSKLADPLPFTPNELKKLTDFIGPLAEGEKVLDLGAGLSGLAPKLAKDNPRVKVIALDDNPKIVEQLIEEHEGLPNLHAVQADMTTSLPAILQYCFDAVMKVQQLFRRLGRWMGLIPPPDVSTPPRQTGQRQGIPLAANSLDKVIMTRTAPENNIERQQLLWQVSRLLKPGGELIIVGTQQPQGEKDTMWRSPAKWLSLLEKMSGFSTTVDTTLGAEYFGIKAINP
jgi:ubiquinone/menaquinone biosynthesis C-methylase UbiE